MSLKIIVLAKQVPDTRNVGPDAMTPEGTVNRAALPAVFNPEDLNALEQALRLKDANPGSTITMLTMGLPKAAEVLKEGLFRGADEGCLLTDRALGGADTLATSYTISQAIKKLDSHPDLILFGKQAIDGDTAQVGPGVAEYLGMTLLCNVKSLEINNNRFRAETSHEDGTDLLEGDLPCVMTVLKEAPAPRFASLSGYIRARKASITKWVAADTGAEPSRLGLNGSPTKVVKIFSPPVRGCDMKCEWKKDKDKALFWLHHAKKSGDKWAIEYLEQ